MNREQLEKLAIEFANSFRRPRNKCPRDVKNAGLYLGFMEAVDIILSEQTKKDTDKVD